MRKRSKIEHAFRGILTLPHVGPNIDWPYAAIAAVAMPIAYYTAGPLTLSVTALWLVYAVCKLLHRSYWRSVRADFYVDLYRE